MVDCEGHRCQIMLRDCLYMCRVLDPLVRWWLKHQNKIMALSIKIFHIKVEYR